MNDFFLYFSTVFLIYVLYSSSDSSGFCGKSSFTLVSQSILSISLFGSNIMSLLYESFFNILNKCLLNSFFIISCSAVISVLS